MKSAHEIIFAGQHLLLDASGALWWSSQRTLIVSDLHLEKSTFLARHGSAIAPYDTLDTLERLEALLTHYQPQELVLLGDSFHDRDAWGRLEKPLRERLATLTARVTQCHWIEGNHDVLLAAHNLPFIPNLIREGILLTHEHEPEQAMPQMLGHYHPKINLTYKGMYLRDRCFVQTSRLLILPAFGSYTGGLDTRHAAFKALTQGEPMQQYLLYKGKVHAL